MSAALQGVFSPEFWALSTLEQLFKRSQLINLVNRDFENTIANRGDIVNTRMPGKIVARDRDGNFVSAVPKAENVPVVLDRWVECEAIKIDDKVQSVSMLDLVRLYINPAAEAIIEAVEGAIVDLYKDLNETIGVAGTTPATVSALGTEIGKKFDDSLIPKMNRRTALNSAATAKLQELFWKVNETGQSTVLREGMNVMGYLGNFFGGGDYYSSQYIKIHTIGGWGATPLVNGNQNPVADPTTTVQTLALKTLGAGQINKGDVFTLNHGGAIGVKSYVVLADQAIAANTAIVNIAPALAAAVVDGQAVTVVANHVANLGFHRDAFALVSRPLIMPVGSGANVSVMNYNGIGLRATIWYEPKDRCHYVQLDILFGVKTLDRRKGFRILG